MTTIEPTTRDSRKVESHSDGTFTVTTDVCRVRSTVNWNLHIAICQIDNDGVSSWKECLSDVLSSDEERDILEELQSALDCFEVCGGI
jgi:hypothetical protein